MLTDYYKQSEIFITGGSGVIGKATIEKLLRSCDVKNIYVLLRAKKGKTVETRFEEMKNSRIFNVLKEEKPHELDKLVVIPGDTTHPGLGISPQHKELLKDVTIFIHSAATTRFDEPLRRAISLNVSSTLEALKLAETLTKLQIFLHVSTLFCNPFVTCLEPKMYPGVFDWKVALKVLEMPEEETDLVLEPIADKIRTDFPNTYVFTKYLAEQLVNDYRSKLPVVIYRPSIVVTAVEEPEVGYTESMNGVMGLFVIWGTGLMQALLCNKEVILDFLPLDICIKAMLVYIVKIGRLKKKTFDDEIPIYLGSSRGLMTKNFGQLRPAISNAISEFPFEKSLWLPNMTLTGCSFIFWFSFFFQLIPFLMIDGLLKLFGKKPLMLSIQRRILTAFNAMKFFLSTDFPSEGTTDVDELSKITKGTAFDINAGINYCITDEGIKSVMQLVARGSRKFLLKEDESTLPRSKKILKAKIILYNILRVFIVFLVGKCIYRRIVN